MRIKIFFIFLCLASMSFITGVTRVNVPFPNHTRYAEMCIKPSLWSQEELDTQVAEYYLKWKERYITDVPDSEPPMKFVNFSFLDYDWIDQTVATVSEAHGYGMTIVAAMAGYDEKAREIFDDMYRYYKKHPSFVDSRLMSWKQLKVKDGNGNLTGVEDVADNDSATDGDLDIAYALLMADRQWGSDGDIDYYEAAIDILDGILNCETHPEFNFMLLGDWTKHKNIMMDGTRSSDFMLNHFSAFERKDVDNSERWKKIREETIKIAGEIYVNYSSDCGLLPDFIVRTEEGKYVPARGIYLETENDGDHNWNSCRVPWRISLDYIVSGNPELYDQIVTMNSWVKKAADMQPLKINPGYFIINGDPGTPIIREWDGTDMSFVAPFAVAALVGTENAEWLDNLWESMISDDWETGTPFDESAYFPNTIRMICMIIVSGNWWTVD